MTNMNTAEDQSPLPHFFSLWDFSQPEVTADKFKERLRTLEKNDADDNLRYQLITQLARTYSLRRKFEKGHHLLDEIDPYYDDFTDRTKIWYHLERGRLFNSANKTAEAIDEFEKAYDIGIETNQDYLTIDAAHMMGIAISDPEDQLMWNMRAIEMSENSTNERAKGWLGALLNNTGWTLHDLERYDEALDIFEKALRWRENEENDQATRIAKWTVARCHRSLNNIDIALEMQKDLLDEYIKADVSPTGYVYEELGELYLIKGDEEKAAIYFKKAYELLSDDKYLQNNEKERLERLKKLARIP